MAIFMTKMAMPKSNYFLNIIKNPIKFKNAAEYTECEKADYD